MVKENFGEQNKVFSSFEDCKKILEQGYMEYKNDKLSLAVGPAGGVENYFDVLTFNGATYDLDKFSDEEKKWFEDTKKYLTDEYN